MKRRRIFFLLSLQQNYYCNVAVWTALNKRLAQLSTLNNRNSPLLSLQKQPMTKSETAFWEDWITLTHNGIRLRAYIQILDATWKVLFLIRGCVKFITMMVDEVYENNVNISPYLIIYIYIQRYSNENWYKLTSLSTPNKKYKSYRIVQYLSLMLYDENSGIISVYLRAW